ncbi:MAG: NAD(P)-dependent oxidoreductase [Chlamydiota bacterium]|nr:NAD(P)-dependent oxidoreductase [Chlamydiota bacterium]
MNIILLQTKLRLEDIDQLLKEFPQFLFLSLGEQACNNLSKDHWSRVEIFFGNKLSIDEIKMAHQLKWIHTPSDDNSSLCMDEINKQGNILISNTDPSDIRTIAEYVFSGIYMFSKNILRWHDAAKFPNLIWDSKWKDSMWDLPKCRLLQIGLGKIGTEVTRIAKERGMKVWGVQEKKSFHPHCHRTIDPKNLHSVLPNMDIIVIALPKGRGHYDWFDKAELELMKRDSALIVIQNNRAVNEKALTEILKKDRLRGVMIDMCTRTPISANSELWKHPDVIITPAAAQHSESEKAEAFHTFRHNLRQYLYGNFNEMRNVVKNLSREK